MDQDDTSQAPVPYQEDTSKSQVDDSDLDQMIASIKGQPVTPPAVIGQSGAPISSSDGSAVSNGQDDNAEPATPAPVAPPPSVPPAPEESPATVAVAPTPAPVAPPMSPAPQIPADLANIKRDALAELRPLVDKLALPPDEKFNTLLLIIRSTDDASLLPAAHEAARAIPDEGRRAQALLDVIKEVDFFGKQAK